MAQRKHNWLSSKEREEGLAWFPSSAWRSNGRWLKRSGLNTARELINGFIFLISCLFNLIEILAQKTLMQVRSMSCFLFVWNTLYKIRSDSNLKVKRFHDKRIAWSSVVCMWAVWALCTESDPQCSARFRSAEFSRCVDSEHFENFLKPCLRVQPTWTNRVSRSKHFSVLLPMGILRTFLKIRY